MLRAVLIVRFIASIPISPYDGFGALRFADNRFDQDHHEQHEETKGDQVLNAFAEGPAQPEPEPEKNPEEEPAGCEEERPHVFSCYALQSSSLKVPDRVTQPHKDAQSKKGLASEKCSGVRGA